MAHRKSWIGFATAAVATLAAAAVAFAAGRPIAGATYTGTINGTNVVAVSFHVSSSGKG